MTDVLQQQIKRGRQAEAAFPYINSVVQGIMSELFNEFVTVDPADVNRMTQLKYMAIATQLIANIVQGDIDLMLHAQKQLEESND